MIPILPHSSDLWENASKYQIEILSVLPGVLPMAGNGQNNMILSLAPQALHDR